MKSYELKQKQNLPLDLKIKLFYLRVKEFYDKFDGNVYLAFSGGKDSSVIMWLLKQNEEFKNIPVVFSNTGLEHKDNVIFARNHLDVELKPKKTFFQVIDTKGVPVISKEVSKNISRYRNTKSEEMKQKYKWGFPKKDGKIGSLGKVPVKYHDFLDTDFPISDECCNALKKEPLKRYEKQTGRKSIVGMMATESNNRKMNYLKYGCNAFNHKNPQCRPIMIFTEQDILQLIKQNNIPISNAYGEIIEKDGELTTTKEKRTGCVSCLYGVQFEERPNRIDRLQQYDNKLFNALMLNENWVKAYIKIMQTVDKSFNKNGIYWNYSF